MVRFSTYKLKYIIYKQKKIQIEKMYVLTPSIGREPKLLWNHCNNKFLIGTFEINRFDIYLNLISQLVSFFVSFGVYKSVVFFWFICILILLKKKKKMNYLLCACEDCKIIETPSEAIAEYKIS